MFRTGCTFLMIGLLALAPYTPVLGRDTAEGVVTSNIFPLQALHVHGPTIVELSNGDLLAAWFQGSGERWADDVAIMGARLTLGSDRWSAPFVMADVPGFPDINPAMFIDGKGTLWLVWYTVMANQWETSLVKFRLSDDYLGEGPPHWRWQDVLHVKPGGSTERGIQPEDAFVKSIETQVASYGNYLAETAGTDQAESERLLGEWQGHASRLVSLAKGEDLIRKGVLFKGDGTDEDAQLGYPYFRRMGWQTKNKALVVGDRIVLPLYSDGFSISLMAITDDFGANWTFSDPLVGAGNIQAGIAVGRSGTLTAYMRDNGPPPNRLHISRSNDRGSTWDPVRDSTLPNPGAGTDIVTLRDGGWVLVYNDTEEGRHSLALAISKDEGRTWSSPRKLSFDPVGGEGDQSHYPALIEGRGGEIHVVYSFHRPKRFGVARKTIRHSRVPRAWLEAPEEASSED